jgi:hypothetical protein
LIPLAFSPDIDSTLLLSISSSLTQSLMYASFEQTQILVDKQVFASLIAIFESLNLDDENDCEDGLNILASFLIVLEKGVQNGQPNKFVQILKN